jgi:hypothetical protein
LAWLLNYIQIYLCQRYKWIKQFKLDKSSALPLDCQIPVSVYYYYSQALLDAVAFQPVMLGHHVQMSPEMMMTVNSEDWKRGHP